MSLFLKEGNGVAYALSVWSFDGQTIILKKGRTRI